MSKQCHSGSDMYKKHRDLISSIMEHTDDFEKEIDGRSEAEVRDCYEGGKCPDCSEDIPTDAEFGDSCGNCGRVFNDKDENESIAESADHPDDCRCKMCKPSIYESDDDFMDKAKKEIDDETGLAMDVAEEHGQLFDNVKHMSWFIQAVADKLKEASTLEEKDMNMGHVASKAEFKHHIANNFDHYKDNIARLYPQDLKRTKDVFLQFLKNQTIDKNDLNTLSDDLDKKIRDVGDPYDEMSNFIEMVKKFI